MDTVCAALLLTLFAMLHPAFAILCVGIGCLGMAIELTIDKLKE